MNHKHLLALFLFFVIIASSRIITKNNDILTVKDVTSNIDKFKIENIREENEEKYINIFYPVTEYPNINEKILKKIEEYKDKFETSVFTADIKKIEISFDAYEYKDYVSFKFNVKSNVGVTHDLNEIFTIVYRNGEIIDIKSLISQNNKLLDILKEESLNKLKENESIKQYSNEEWLNKGLEKSEENYENFILTEKSFVLIFNPYKIAPYVAGTIEVEIPYDKLEIFVD